MTDAAPPPAKQKSRPSAVRPVLIIAIFIVVSSLPIIGLMFTPLGPGAGAAALGIIATAMGIVVGGVRRGFHVMLWNIIAIGLCPIGLVYPAVGVMIFIVLGALTGLAAYRGMDTPIFTLSVLVGITMLNPPALTAAQVSDGVTVTPSYILMLTGVTAIGAVWVFLFMSAIHKKLPHPPLAPLHRESAMVYGATLALLTGTAAAVALTWFPYSLAGWVILTIYVIFRPVYKGDTVVHGMHRRVINRIIGTIGGVVIAGAVAYFITNANALILLGIVFFVAAGSRQVIGAPYWQFVLFLTPAVIFMTSSGVHVDRVGLVRLACTAIGIVMALGALEFNRRFTFPWIAESKRLESAHASLDA